ncbi:MAG: twin-arginine translocase subunit TatC [Planctomycetaceae bacterium]|nr:twin-arginine translocase subunit TatC [Planctomycetaceae bacterium]
MSGSKDLFDDSTMTFGEHLEVLRVHLWKAIIGLVICVVVTLFFGHNLIAVIRAPIDNALYEHGQLDSATDDVSGLSSTGLDVIWKFFQPPVEPKSEIVEGSTNMTITVHVDPTDIAAALHSYDPDRYPAVEVEKEEPKKEGDKKTEEGEDKKSEEGEDKKEGLPLKLTSEHFRGWQKTSEDIKKPVTLNVQEAFLMFLKVSLVAGLIFSSPWVFYQIWQFVAAGLYPHEQKFVWIFLPVSIGLFMGGALFCFFLVFPFILDFLLGFNAWLEVQPQIRLSEWISFAIMLPLMFGISFQLPLVMLFLERISIFEASDYREKRRLAVLVIAILSMFLTPADPMSMIMMMIPLIFLYELGILFCLWKVKSNSVEPEAAS